MRLLVTCFHVWEAYTSEKAKSPDAILAVVLGTGLKTRIFDPIFIDGDKDIDLAIFCWKETHIGDKMFFFVRQFPIPRVASKSIIALQGFPGALREGTESRGGFGACFFGGLVTAVSDRKFLVEGNPGQLRFVQTEKPAPPIKIGGMSGSPAYTFRSDWELAGFLLEGSTTDGSRFFSHASFLQPDGTLDRSQLK
jgi:hypothetical protein